LIKSYPNKYVVCEATAEPKVYARTDICGGAFAFGLENQISKAAKGETEAIQKVAQYYTQAPHTLASFASNHDQFAGKRLWDQVNGNEVHYKLAAATYLLLPGTPFIYYGEEIGMAGAKGLTDDPFIRGPYSWLPNEATAGFTTGLPYRAVSGNVSTHHAQIQKVGADSLWSFYRDMVALRNTRTSLAKGSYEAAQAQGQVLTYQRKAGQEHSVVVINYGAQSVPLTIEGLASNATLRALYPAKGVVNQKGGQVTVPAQSVHVFAVEK
jgi:glycosidase